MQVLLRATVKIPCMGSVQMFGVVVFDMLTNCPRYGSRALRARTQILVTTLILFFSSLPKDSGGAPCIHADRDLSKRKENSAGL